MEEGNKEDKGSVGGPIMLMRPTQLNKGLRNSGGEMPLFSTGSSFRFVLVFIFAASKALKMNWPLVGQVASMDNGTSKEGRAVGCPLPFGRGQLNSAREVYEGQV